MPVHTHTTDSSSLLITALLFVLMAIATSIIDVYAAYRHSMPLPKPRLARRNYHYTVASGALSALVAGLLTKTFNRPLIAPITPTASPGSFAEYLQAAQVAVRHATTVLSKQAAAVADTGILAEHDMVNGLRGTIDLAKPTQVAAFLAACVEARKWLDGLPAEAEARREASWAENRERHAAAIEIIRAAAAEAVLASEKP